MRQHGVEAAGKGSFRVAAEPEGAREFHRHEAVQERRGHARGRQHIGFAEHSAGAQIATPPLATAGSPLDFCDLC